MVLDKDPAVKDKQVYSFASNTGVQFVFNDHCPGICRYCKLFAGYHSLSHDEYLAASSDMLGESAADREPYQFLLPVEMSLV